jgi:hypothetical protein
MINAMDSDDGKRAMIAIFPDEDIACSTVENDVGLIEGKKENLKELYFCLKDMFDDGEEDEC